MENEEMIPEIRQIYADYLIDVMNLEAKRKPTDGLMGFGKRTDYDPCHERFAEKLEQKLKDIENMSPSSEEAGAVLRYVFNAPQEEEGSLSAYWMLLAVHGYTDGLISFLSKQDAKELSELYADLYPKHKRLPVQQNIASHLQEQAGGSKKSKGLFGFLKSWGSKDN